MPYQVAHTVQGGIERIVYTPEQPRFRTPLLFQHGMWHGAWCWQAWQALFAEWGWTSIAFSLPGHARSPVQRPLRWCTLGYYHRFLSAEIERLTPRPVVIGHSMGGALIQWHLKYRGDLVSSVLVAPWPAHSMFQAQGRPNRLDPLGTLLCFLTLAATPMVRTPARAAAAFLTEGAIVPPADLHRQLGPESLLVLMQYGPPFWSPVTHTETPLLWLAGGADALFPEASQRESAAHYGATYAVIPHTGHDMMLERSYQETAMIVHDWLGKQPIE